MNLLLIVREDLGPFGEPGTAELLRGIPGLYDLSTSTLGDRFSADFDHESDSTTIRLSDDLRRISISGAGPASRRLVLLVAGALRSEKLRLFDLDYSFDARLSETTTDEELRLLLVENGKD